MQKKRQLIVFLLLSIGTIAPAQVMQYAGTEAMKVEPSAYLGKKFLPVLLLDVKAVHSYTPLTLLQFSLQATGRGKNTHCTVKVFYSESKDSFSTATLFALKEMKNSRFTVQGEQELHSGSNFFWVTIKADSTSNEILPDLQFVSCATGLQQYQTAWADEFDKDGPPDTTNWRYERGFVRNEEDQWYQPENAFCKNGILTIEARRGFFSQPPL